ncbi:MAG: HIT family protein [Pseudomonadota bacterium]
MTTLNIPAYDPENIFSKIIAGDIPSHKVYEDDDTFVFMDIMPRADGHMLVIPKTGARNILDIAPETLTKVILVTQKMAKAAMTALDADGITLSQFSEPAGGQEVYHLHFHVIPRKQGVTMKPPASFQEDHGKLAEIAEKIRAAL